MFNEINHQYTQYKNQEFNWLTSDLEELYLENVKTNYNVLSEYGWVDCKFTYKFNSHGFRCDEFTNEDSIAFFGCSYTCGIGLPLENMWAYHVANNLNLKSVNLGIGSTGPGTSFKLANHYIPQIMPKIVVYVEPPPARFSISSADGYIYDLSVSTEKIYAHDQLKDFYNHWISLAENSDLDYLKNKLAIQLLCHQNKIKFVYARCNEMHNIDLARDLGHRGVKSNLQFSKFILNRLSKNS
jgi:hypothetical protein